MNVHNFEFLSSLWQIKTCSYNSEVQQLGIKLNQYMQHSEMPYQFTATLAPAFKREIPSCCSCGKQFDIMLACYFQKSSSLLHVKQIHFINHGPTAQIYLLISSMQNNPDQAKSNSVFRSDDVQTNISSTKCSEANIYTSVSNSWKLPGFHPLRAL